MGDPQEPTDPLIREALVAGLRDRMGYPAAVGLPELREAIAAWAASALRRRARPGHGSDPDARQQGGDLQLRARRRRRRRRRATRLRTPTPVTRSTSAALSSRTRGRWRFRCTRRTASCPTWTRSTTRRGLGLRSSGSTTPTTRPARPRRSPSTSELAGLAREHGFVLASDEAYTELWFGEPPASALQVEDLTNVVVFNTLSQAELDDGLSQRLRSGRPRS